MPASKTIMLGGMLIAVILVTSIGIYTYYQNMKQPQQTNTGNKEPLATIILDYGPVKETEQYQVKLHEGDTVFSVLTTVATVNYTMYGELVFIDAINGVWNDKTLKGYWWVYYYNGDYGTVAANKQYVENASIITWEYSKV